MPPTPQNFWRCAHHTSAIENFFSTRQTCEWGCHTTELRWYHSGESPMPKSWAEPRGTALADKVFGDRFEPYLATQTRFGKGPC